MSTPLLVLCSIVLVILLTSKAKLNAFFALTFVALGLALATLSTDQVVPTLKTGFGNTLAAIGLIILFGTTIGVILDRTGATHAMALAILRLTGKDKAPRAIAMTGFITGLPIFCDSGFIVLSGLNKSLARASGTSMVRMAASLAIAMYALHCLIPPHPGITAAAGIMDGSIGNLVLLGTAIALPSAIAGYAWVKFMSRRGATEGSVQHPADDIVPENLPSAGLSFLPVVTPLVLITLSSIIGVVPSGLPQGLVTIMKLLGDPVIALLIGVLLAVPLIRRRDLRRLNELLAEAIEKAGPILAITAAGGTFGAVIKATGMGDQLTQLLAASNLGLVVPFLVAAILKTAQGSSTVAAITTASIVAPMLAGLGLDSESGRLLALLALGSGSMTISHANDSYYWVVTRFSDISPDATLKVFSSATVVVAACSFILTWLLSFALI